MKLDEIILNQILNTLSFFVFGWFVFQLPSFCIFVYLRQLTLPVQVQFPVLVLLPFWELPAEQHPHPVMKCHLISKSYHENKFQFIKETEGKAG